VLGDPASDGAILDRERAQEADHLARGFLQGPSTRQKLETKLVALGFEEVARRIEDVDLDSLVPAVTHLPIGHERVPERPGPLRRDRLVGDHAPQLSPAASRS
jgi:hypothetical protein